MGRDVERVVLEFSLCVNALLQLSSWSLPRFDGPTFGAVSDATGVRFDRRSAGRKSWAVRAWIWVPPLPPPPVPSTRSRESESITGAVDVDGFDRRR